MPAQFTSGSPQVSSELTWLPLYIREASDEGIAATVRATLEEDAGTAANITVVVPEFSLPRSRHPVLHRQGARRIYAQLQAPGITTVIVPFTLAAASRRVHPGTDDERGASRRAGPSPAARGGRSSSGRTVAQAGQGQSAAKHAGSGARLSRIDRISDDPTIGREPLMGPRAEDLAFLQRWVRIHALGDTMALEVDGGRGTTGRLSTFRAAVVNVVAVILIVAYASIALALVVAAVRFSTR
ncbi:MAG: hypothetical protein QOF60_213 [Actinomycetota bacterium]|nr:hypothetical protein [Actinomycetota bacterium]